ncbi:MAG TPA: condensation domain-containing protein, partial [Thermoanaerobaculia bacterium]|nr:condensation domain-containing protein [Thermoanaerobaculia bacterium]
MPESPDFATPDAVPDEGEVFVAPASFAQQRLWLLDRILPGLPTYNLPLGLRLSGDLDAGRLGRALEEMVARHETLRTAIGVEDDLPVQLIATWADLALPQVDLAGLSSEAAEGEMRRCLGEQAA